MWRFKPFSHKEPTGLEGRSIDIGEIKVHVKNVIAEGGFSCVYLAKDALSASKQYAIKHMICNDQESLDLVMKEVSVMKSLKGHPNIVTLYSHTVMDMGRTKEAVLVMEYCEKSLVNVLESRGTNYFEEKQVIAIFKDVCNAVFAMHCQSPPIAHRDLKAENLLLGSDGLWKLCDFGSISTNHKVFERPEDMGIEEDNIRKHTTPAYRAPEMWDLYRRDLINEKVDIWALGCLLYRVCYFKSAFDGESKLQVLNGNYRIPDLPKYSASVTDLIRDMLQSSPDCRPDITQVWFRVNEQLPVELQKSLPDQPPQMCNVSTRISEGNSNPTTRTSNLMPRRSPPPVPSPSEASRNPSHSNSTRGGSPMGAFWSTKHANDSLVKDDNSVTKFDDDSSTLKGDRFRVEKHQLPGKTSASGRENNHANPLSKDDRNHGSENTKGTTFHSTPTSGDEGFNAFVAEFDANKLSPVGSTQTQLGEDDLSCEVERLREQLKQANFEKAEVTAKYEKLVAICRSQRQELQELKQASAAQTLSPDKETLKIPSSSSNQPSPNPQRHKVESTVSEPQKGVGLFDQKSGKKPESEPWQPFTENTHSKTSTVMGGSVSGTSKSVRTRNGHPSKHNGSSLGLTNEGWGFGNDDNFSAIPAASARISRSTCDVNNSQQVGGESKTVGNKTTASQPAGWAGF